MIGPRRAVDAVAAKGYGAGGGDYERSRPSYPREAVDLLIEKLSLHAGNLVVELGAGTGKLTRMFNEVSASLFSVEPVPAMRDQLRRAVPLVPVVAAVAEAVPIADHSVDAVVAGTAFHWFRGDDALSEIARVLRPGGGVGLVWNNPDRTTSWVSEVWEIVDQHRGEVPGNRDLRWREAFDRATSFTSLEHRTFSYEDELSIDDLLVRVASISFIAALPEDQRNAVLERVRRIARSHPSLAGRSHVPLPYRSDVYWCLRE